MSVCHIRGKEDELLLERQYGFIMYKTDLRLWSANQ